VTSISPPVVLAVKSTGAEEAVAACGDGLSGKTVLDGTKPIADNPPVNGVFQFFTGPNETLMERLQRRAPLAGLHGTLGKSARYRRLLESGWFFVIPGAVLATGLVEDRARIAFVFGALVVNAGLTLCVDRRIRFPDSTVSRLLAAAPIVAVGRASYSIYLWQQ
jgi:peptidoglycan/LPS O-acetylase OafA/YrhL